jgi:hypothetical protein
MDYYQKSNIYMPQCVLETLGGYGNEEKNHSRPVIPSPYLSISDTGLSDMGFEYVAS